MKKYILILFGVLLSLSSILFQNCAVLIEGNCDLDQFMGTYVGKYRVAGLVPINQNDTVTIELDSSASNRVRITSTSLDTFFFAKFLEAKSELEVEPFDIPSFEFEQYLLETIEIRAGMLSLDGACDNLVLDLNKVYVTKHNIGALVPQPFPNASLESDLNNMIRQL